MSDLLSCLAGKSCTLNLSVIEHLRYFLSMHQGSLTHLPDYGIKPFVGKHIEKDKQAAYCQHLSVQIRKYEPRIKQLVIRPVVQNEPCVSLSLSVQLILADDNPYQIQCVVQTNGKVIVNE